MLERYDLHTLQEVLRALAELGRLLTMTKRIGAEKFYTIVNLKYLINLCGRVFFLFLFLQQT